MDQEITLSKDMGFLGKEDIETGFILVQGENYTACSYPTMQVQAGRMSDIKLLPGVYMINMSHEELSAHPIKKDLERQGIYLKDEKWLRINESQISSELGYGNYGKKSQAGSEAAYVTSMTIVMARMAALLEDTQIALGGQDNQAREDIRTKSSLVSIIRHGMNLHHTKWDGSRLHSELIDTLGETGLRVGADVPGHARVRLTASRFHYAHALFSKYVPAVNCEWKAQPFSKKRTVYDILEKKNEFMGFYPIFDVTVDEMDSPRTGGLYQAFVQGNPKRNRAIMTFDELEAYVEEMKITVSQMIWPAEYVENLGMEYLEKMSQGTGVEGLAEFSWTTGMMAQAAASASMFMRTQISAPGHRPVYKKTIQSAWITAHDRGMMARYVPGLMAAGAKYIQGYVGSIDVTCPDSQEEVCKVLNAGWKMGLIPHAMVINDLRMMHQKPDLHPDKFGGSQVAEKAVAKLSLPENLKLRDDIDSLFTFPKKSRQRVMDKLMERMDLKALAKSDLKMIEHTDDHGGAGTPNQPTSAATAQTTKLTDLDGLDDAIHYETQKES